MHSEGIQTIYSFLNISVISSKSQKKHWATLYTSDSRKVEALVTSHKYACMLCLFCSQLRRTVLQSLSHIPPTSGKALGYLKLGMVRQYPSILLHMTLFILARSIWFKEKDENFIYSLWKLFFISLWQPDQLLEWLFESVFCEALNIPCHDVSLILLGLTSLTNKTNVSFYGLFFVYISN